ncbi:hypothetical protein ACWC1D_21305 [Streptomyces sp. NPDC001478]
MGKKQSRQNRGARTGGRAYGAPSESKDQKSTAPASDPVKAISEQTSHKHDRKFGHN